MNRSRRGFTMLELLLASALAVVLTAAVLAVAAGLSRDTQRMARRAAELPAGAAELIRWDLVHAAKVMQDEGALTLIGNGELDARRLRPAGGLVRVTYKIESNRLLREQVALDQPLEPGAWRELVAGGIDSLRVDGLAAGAEVNAPWNGVVRVGLTGGGGVEISWRR